MKKVETRMQYILQHLNSYTQTPGIEQELDQKEVVVILRLLYITIKSLFYHNYVTSWLYDWLSCRF